MSQAKHFFEKHRKLAVLIGIGILIILPQLTRSNYIRGVLARIIVYATLASGLNIINGYSGQSCLALPASGPIREPFLQQSWAFRSWQAFSSPCFCARLPVSSSPCLP